MVTIIHVKDYADVVRAKRLFVDLATCLDFAALFHGVQDELEELPSTYTPPEGCLLIAEVDMHVVGCSAVKRIDGTTCELKRLYVLPGYRRQGIGITLAKAAINEAHSLGYAAMRLSTLPSMKAALAVYDRLGFTAVGPEACDGQKDTLVHDGWLDASRDGLADERRDRHLLAPLDRLLHGHRDEGRAHERTGKEIRLELRLRKAVDGH